MFVITDGPVTPIVEAFRALSTCFRLKVESIDTVQTLHDNGLGVPFLDVELFPVPVAGKFLFCSKPYMKPSSLWKPLSHSSCHSMAVHAAWPVSYCRRLVMHSTLPSDAAGSIAWLDMMLKRYSPGHPAIGQLTSHVSTKRVKPRTSYMVMPYHRVLSEAHINGVLTSFDVTLQMLGSPVARLAWKLSGRHLGQLAKTC